MTRPFAVDHGLCAEAEGYGNGDSAFYPGAASNLNQDRGYDDPLYALEIRNRYGHDNLLGYGLPNALGMKRYVCEPLVTLKTYACGQYNLEQRRMPLDCDWWGAYAAAPEREPELVSRPAT